MLTASLAYAQAFTHALYNLAAQPQYIKPLRDEVEGIIAEDGWSKISIGKMRKLDSFLRESQRVNGPTTGAPHPQPARAPR